MDFIFLSKYFWRPTLNKIKEIVKKKETVKKKKPTQFTIVRICKNLQECDIDKISKIIMDIGRKKDYPDITN